MYNHVDSFEIEPHHLEDYGMGDVVDLDGVRASKNYIEIYKPGKYPEITYAITRFLDSSNGSIGPYNVNDLHFKLDMGFVTVKIERQINFINEVNMVRIQGLPGDNEHELIVSGSLEKGPKAADSTTFEGLLIAYDRRRSSREWRICTFCGDETLEWIEREGLGDFCSLHCLMEEKYAQTL